MTIKTIHRGLHGIAGVLALLAAAVVAFGVIPDVISLARTDPTVNEAAATGFWMNVVCNVLVGIAVLAGTFMVSAWRRRLLLGSAAILALLLGLLLLDAAEALSTHGHAMDAATARTLLGALADLAAVTLILLVAGLRVLPRFLSARREHKIEQIAEQLTVRRRGTISGDNWDAAVDIYNQRHHHRPDAPRDQTITSPGNGEVGAENGDLASTRSS